MDAKEISNRFTYHPPTDGKPEMYTEIRMGAKVLAKLIDKHAPDGREKALAITHLEETVMWANAGIARGE